MYKVLVLCHANRFRSPLAMGCIQQYLHNVNLLSLNPVGVTVISAGFKAAGHKAGLPVRNAAAELGFSLEDHRSRECTWELVQDSDLIVYMDNGNFRRLQQVVDCREKPGGIDCINLGSKCLPARNRIEDLAFISPRTRPADFDRVVRYIQQACCTLVETVIAPEARKRQA